MNTRNSIVEKCKALEELLLKKNDAYGDAALQPLGVFSTLKASDGIKVRLDDKLKRIANVGINDKTEDTLMDCVGYMILLMIAIDNEGNNIQERIREGKPSPHTSVYSTSTYSNG
jgi:hypothetical protein